MAIWMTVLGRKLMGDEGIKQVSEQEYKELLRGYEDHKAHILPVWQMFRDFRDMDTLYLRDV